MNKIEELNRFYYEEYGITNAGWGACEEYYDRYVAIEEGYRDIERLRERCACEYDFDDAA